jgi:hypothetical protein
MPLQSSTSDFISQAVQENHPAAQMSTIIYNFFKYEYQYNQTVYLEETWH